VDVLCRKLKQDTFKFVILISVDDALAKLEFQGHDLFISPLMLTEEVSVNKARIVAEVQSLWK
jgi:hypothetical protein